MGNVPKHSEINKAAWQPLIDAIVEAIAEKVAERLAESQADAPTDGPLWIPESEAAPKLSMARHQLRDLRLKGLINYRRGPGRKIFYAPADLAEFVAKQQGGRS